MSININNYEHYLIDYLDGKLTPVEVSEVLLFLEQHPGIKSELDGLEKVSVPVDISASLDLDALKKPVYDEIKQDYEQLLIAELEGDLTTEEYIVLTQAKQVYPDLEKDARAFSQTRLLPETVVFSGKKHLKKAIAVPLYQQAWVRIAAVLFLIGFAGLSWFGFNRVSPVDQTSMLADPSGKNQAGIAQDALPDKKGGSVQYPGTDRSSDNTAHSLNKSTSGEGHNVKEPGAGESSGNRNIPLSKLATLASRKSTITGKHINEVMIEPRSPVITPPAVVFDAPVLTSADHQLRYSAPPGTDDYINVKQLAVRQMKKKKEQLLGKNETGHTLSLLQALNKATGDNVKVDTNAAGKIKRLEVAGLGFEWSHSK